MANLERTAKPKPVRGECYREHHEKRQTRHAAERKAMRAAKARDKAVTGGCRWPRCDCRNQYPIHACHSKHRGMGGNPTGDRTKRELLISFCGVKHSAFDTGLIDVIPKEAALYDGPCNFYERSASGRMELVASETTIGASVTRT